MQYTESRQPKCAVKPALSAKLLTAALAFVLTFGTAGWAQGTGGGAGAGSDGTGAGGSGSTSGGAGAAASAQWSGVQSALGMTGEVRPSGIIKFSLVAQGNPNVKGIGLKPETVLHGYLAFGSLSGVTGASASAGTSGSTSGATAGATATTTGATALMTGEFAVPINNVAAIVRALERANLQISAIHKHVFGDDPRAAFIHLEQAGDATQMATAVASAMKTAGINVREETHEAATAVQGLNVQGLQSTFAAANAGANTGNAVSVEALSSNGVLELAVPRAEQFTTCGGAVNNATAGASGGAAAGGTTTVGTTATATGAATNGNNFGAGANALNTCMLNALQLDVAASGGSTTSASTGGAGSGNVIPAELIGAVFEVRVQPLGGGNRAFVTAEVPLLPTEVDAFLRVVSESNVQFDIGELHNHTKLVSPALLFLHISGVGDANQMVEVLRAAWANNNAVASGSSTAIQGAPSGFSGTAAGGGTGTGTGTATGGGF